MLVDRMVEAVEHPGRVVVAVDHRARPDLEVEVEEVVPREYP